VAGLLPLAFSASTLWPPMAWAIISGLLASTLLTLLVIPALCCTLMRASAQPTATTPAPLHG
jgi:multidrug efflux pump subunit AcrB